MWLIWLELSLFFCHFVQLWDVLIKGSNHRVSVLFHSSWCWCCYWGQRFWAASLCLMRATLIKIGYFWYSMRLNSFDVYRIEWTTVSRFAVLLHLLLVRKQTFILKLCKMQLLLLRHFTSFLASIQSLISRHIRLPLVFLTLHAIICTLVISWEQALAEIQIMCVQFSVHSPVRFERFTGDCDITVFGVFCCRCGRWQHQVVLLDALALRHCKVWVSSFFERLAFAF